MRILVCTFSFPYFKKNIYDARFVYSEVIGYAENGADVIVLTPHFPGAMEDENLGNHITIKRFPYFLPRSFQKLREPGKPIYDINSISALIQIPILCLLFMLNIFRYANNVDIIHAQWTPTALLALPAKWILRKKLVLTARGSDIRLLPQWLNKFIFRKVDAALDCFGPTQWNIQNKSTFQANYIKLPHLVHDDSSGKIPEEIKAIKNVTSNVLILIYIGRFHPIKINENKLPLFDLIDASYILKKNNGFDFHVFYIGDGPPQIEDKLRNLIAERQMTKYVTLLGAKTNVMDYIHYCDLGIGGIAFNGVSQEFTICNKPQLLVDVTENSNTPWQHGVNCLFIKPGNIDDLVETISWAHANRSQLNSIGKQAASDMKHYFVEAKKGGHYYLDVFNELINTGKYKK